ncbi:MAG TPA: GNAT family protein, partial [Myxococcota bacterium]|nr:GNAT family protein [Myxococcota bacterium]
DATRDIVLVGEAEGRLVCLGGLHRHGGPARAHVRVLGCSVATAYQGRGVGQALVRGLVDAAWEAGARRLELEVYADNHRARALYSRMGFVEEGTLRRDAFGSGVYLDVIVMARLADEKTVQKYRVTRLL